MTRKKSAASASASASASPTTTAASPGGALGTLLGLIEPKPAAPAKAGTITGLEAQMNDPAIKGAKRVKNTAQLGFDPTFAERVLHGSKLSEAMKTAKALFEGIQTELREYGAEKRKVFMEAFRCEVTTVNVPYVVDVPVDPDSATPGKETRYLSVICTNKYSVSQDAVKALKEELGDAYGKLFQEETTKTLRPNAEELFKQILKDQGLDDAKVEAAMKVLFDEDVVVSTQEDYEKRHAELPEATQTVLNQSVVRQQPGLKFL